jgi:hypothetical protein
MTGVGLYPKKIPKPEPPSPNPGTQTQVYNRMGLTIPDGLAATVIQVTFLYKFQRNTPIHRTAPPNNNGDDDAV